MRDAMIHVYHNVAAVASVAVDFLRRQGFEHIINPVSPRKQANAQIARMDDMHRRGWVFTQVITSILMLPLLLITAPLYVASRVPSFFYAAYYRNAAKALALGSVFAAVGTFAFLHTSGVFTAPWAIAQFAAQSISMLGVTSPLTVTLLAASLSCVAVGVALFVAKEVARWVNHERLGVTNTKQLLTPEATFKNGAWLCSQKENNNTSILENLALQEMRSVAAADAWGTLTPMHLTFAKSRLHWMKDDVCDQTSEALDAMTTFRGRLQCHS